MRKINFRAWDKTNKKMIYPDDINGMFYDEVGGNWVVIQANGWLTEEGNKKDALLICYENWGLLQYTGLKDKSGKKIYEGDITESEDGTCRWEVVFENGAFKQLDRKSVFYDEDFYRVKVIGNIYENPKLLGGKR